MAYKTMNPALNEKTFISQGTQVSSGPPMTLEGTIGKSFLLVLAAIGGAAFSFQQYTVAKDQNSMLALAGIGALIGFLLALVIIIKKQTAPYLSIFYAVFEGLMLGALSAAYESRFPGIVINTLGLTFGTFLAMLAAYQSKLIVPTAHFKLIVVAATGGIAILYIVDLILKLAFHMPIMLIHDTGIVGILFSGFIVCIAALNLVLDFDFIQTGVQSGAPEYMEWYASFGLLVTLVWLYLEILRMLGKSRSR